MVDKLRDLFLRPSRKNPQVRRWQNPWKDTDTEPDSITSVEKKFFTGKNKPVPLGKSHVMEYPSMKRLLANTRHAHHAENVMATTRVGLVDLFSPLVDYFVAEHGWFSPMAIPDNKGNTLIVLPEDLERDFPRMASILKKEMSPNIPLDEQIATHEFAHAWDRGGGWGRNGTLSSKDLSLSGKILEHGIGWLGGRLPVFTEEIQELHPRIPYANSPLEFPAVITELALAEPEVVSKLHDNIHFSWMDTYLNMLWGSDLGTKVVRGGGQ